MRMKFHHSDRSKPNRARVSVLFYGALAALFALAGCGGSGEQASKMTSFSTAESAESKAELFSLPADQMSHIRIYTVAQAPLERTLRLSGAVAYNGYVTTPVITQVGGPVSRILVTPGEHVKAGQPLLYVASPDYSLTRSAYIKARAASQLTDRSYKRAQDLYAHQAISQADLEQAESNRAQAEADLQSSEQAIRVLGIANPESILTAPSSAELPLLAPMAGEIVERLCSPGQLLQAGGTQCFTLSDMNSVWVLVNVYQNDIAYVHVGEEVTIDNETYPGVVRGKIQYVAPALDPTTRTLQARIEASNPGERLKRDMYVTAEVRAGVIPNALIGSGCGGSARFRKHAVRLPSNRKQPVRAAHGNAGRKPIGENSNCERAAGRRQSRGRRQLVPPIPEFDAALSRGHRPS